MGEYWKIIQEYLDEHGTREAAFARLIGTSASTVNSWKLRGVRQLPSVELLEAVAQRTGTPYATVLEAALSDANYSVESRNRKRNEEGTPD